MLKQGSLISRLWTSSGVRRVTRASGTIQIVLICITPKSSVPLAFGLTLPIVSPSTA
jgi:hypothetical protein